MTGFPRKAGFPPGVTVDVFAAAFEASPTPMVVTDPRRPDNPIIWSNAAFLTLTGYDRDELYGHNCRLLQGPLTDRATLDALRATTAQGGAFECELMNYRKDGTPFWNGMTISPVRDAAGEILYFFSAQADMTDKHRLEAALRDANGDLEREVGERTADLRAALAQKTALLHEVDHRVKNNLQVIASLMLLKARRTPVGEAREAVQAMADRIGALSTVHRMLYSAGDAAHFDLEAFTGELVADLTAGLAPDGPRVEIAAERLALPAAMAAPLALLLHELATNAVRHAFPGPEVRAGRVRVSARRCPEGMDLAVEDDGIGLAAAAACPDGFGRTLVAMVVRQLRGTLHWSDAGPGTRADIRIPLAGDRAP
ncbi:histidine kinase dimerization/phosphoacceptor domain -containing protein [Methylobacterium sp. Leaf118]|uniref:histidine kinase dimerization/phosphoacceptor domain -containing protein n=1 Tax=Methylobacterium sp. Leaf118 TaxID=2876562 RepID=UPI001E577552|nr:PAS domain-containing protein [Methylobacterium sp. Leaf118]